MKVRIRPHPEIWKEFNIKGIPYWYMIPGIQPRGHSGYRKVMLMLNPDKNILSPNEQKVYEPVTEVIDEKKNIASGFFEDKTLIIEEYDEETLPKIKRQNIKGGD